MYLWANLHWDDDFSWTLASVVPADFWQLWSLLTLRSIHITADEDCRGMCGFLRTAELERFIELLTAIHIPTHEEEREGLDLFGSEEELQNIHLIRTFAQQCLEKGYGMAWFHDFL